MKEPHTALFIAPTGVGKTHLALNLLETEYRDHFNFIVIICPTLEHNETYRSRGWVWNSIAEKCFDIWGILKMVSVKSVESSNKCFSVNHIIRCRSKFLLLGFSKFVLVLIL